MCKISSDEALGRIASRLESAASLLIVTHDRPDGDALGSAAALLRGAISAGKDAWFLSADPAPRRYQFLLDGLPVADAGRLVALTGRADLIVILDTCSLSQLEGIAAGLAGARDKTVVIDHHTGPEDLAEVQWIDPSAAAAGVMVGELIERLSWPIAPAMAEALAAAILTDTGWLRFSNTDPRSLTMVAKLVEAGARPDELYRRIYQNDRPQRLALKARALASVELHCDSRLAVMTLLADDFAATGATGDETEDLVNEAMNVAGVEAAVMIVQQGDQVRASLRSKSQLNVAQIAQGFGGGGHAKAAGCRRKGDPGAFKNELIDACSRALASV